jgi:hypothetical protein
VESKGSQAPDLGRWNPGSGVTLREPFLGLCFLIFQHEGVGPGACEGTSVSKFQDSRVGLTAVAISLHYWGRG